MLLEADASVAVSLFWMALAAVVAPIVARATRQRIPEIVVLLTAGIIIGPSVTNLAQTDGNEMVSQLGMGLLFLLAGMEIELKSLTGRIGKWAILTWGVGFLMALGIGYIMIEQATLTQAVALALAVTSTALGALLPILKSKGLLTSKLGQAVMTNGAVGELGPVLVMALLLTTHSPWQAGLLMGVFAAVTVAAVAIPRRLLARVPQVSEATETEHRVSTQSLLRSVMLLLTALMALAAVFEFDVVLGAFAAGIVIKRLTGTHFEPVMHSVEKISYGFFIPMFFVGAGMNIPLAAVLENPWQVVLFVVVIVVARGLPVLVAELWFTTDSGLRTVGQKQQLALYSATGLPIIVAVTDIAVASELMSEGVAASLVTAGALTVLLFPLLADLIPVPRPRPASAAEPSLGPELPKARTDENGDIIVPKSEEAMQRDREAAQRRQQREAERGERARLKEIERQARAAEKAAIERVREYEKLLDAAIDGDDHDAAKAARSQLRAAEADAFEARSAADQASNDERALSAPPTHDSPQDVADHSA
ncbi:MAG: cation:proton antiporter [Arachnia sp.]